MISTYLASWHGRCSPSMARPPLEVPHCGRAVPSTRSAGAARGVEVSAWKLFMGNASLPWYFIIFHYFLLAFNIGRLKIQLMFKLLVFRFFHDVAINITNMQDMRNINYRHILKIFPSLAETSFIGTDWRSNTKFHERLLLEHY